MSHKSLSVFIMTTIICLVVMNEARSETENGNSVAAQWQQKQKTSNLSEGGQITSNSTESTNTGRSDEKIVRTTAIVINDGAEGLSWINQQPSTNYTLQLMAAASHRPLLAYVRKESLAAPLAIAGLKKEDKVIYLLLQGSYATRNEAESAAAQFEKQNGVRPWIRKFASLPELFPSDAPSLVKHESLKRPTPTVVGASWLWSRNPVHYTIQLVDDRKIGRLRTVVDGCRPAAPLAIVRVKRKGKPWYLLLAGDYATESEALAAIKDLPKELNGGSPSPFTFASLQDQMVAANH